MKLVANWRAVLKRAWSMQLIALSLLFSGLEVAVPFLNGLLPVSQGTFAVLAGLSTIAAGIARLLVQMNVEAASAEPEWESGERK